MTLSDGAAVVLGPGGLVGTAWLLGLAAGLRRDGVDLADAGLIVGTSAGAIAGAVLATGGDPRRLAVLPERSGPQVRPDPHLMTEVFSTLGDPEIDPTDARRRAGRIALSAPTVPEATHIADMRFVIGAEAWPARRLLITAVDLETGQPVVWDGSSGVPLSLAVAASCAMPAAYPPVLIAGRRYMDGALAGGSHSHLAVGADPVVVIEPMAPRVGSPGGPAGAAAVVRIAADDAAQDSFGTDLGDRTHWEPAYQSGENQAAAAAARIREALGQQATRHAPRAGRGVGADR
ncbi:patatin [Parafrankia colletiae]|uniref:Patatin n=1 Tax=Parafrankia colletiae TaxID=573497 RepID=A0A1S1Q9D6_9ACTN|nr:patatin-like phospholipase family protein [Parafrankia colletiae]MCK9902556.1 patatin-like phospholipase family protein [Frankia sp. Cpl3]OHV31463.1 patatin [Parafrankia colletiae]